MPAYSHAGTLRSWNAKPCCPGWCIRATAGRRPARSPSSRRSSTRSTASTGPTCSTTPRASRSGCSGTCSRRTCRPGDLERARALREALRSLLLANNGEPPDPGAQDVLEQAGRRAGLEAAFPPDGAALVPAAGGVDGALGRILAAAFAAMLDGSWQRLKACPRDVCGWAFYDRSTNASATWCSMRVCGGRVKAGAYYRRRRAAGH